MHGPSESPPSVHIIYAVDSVSVEGSRAGSSGRLQRATAHNEPAPPTARAAATALKGEGLLRLRPKLRLRQLPLLYLGQRLRVLSDRPPVAFVRAHEADAAVLRIQRHGHCHQQAAVVVPNESPREPRRAFGLTHFEPRRVRHIGRAKRGFARRCRALGSARA